ncbi:L-lactate permease [Escherichia coli]
MCVDCGTCNESLATKLRSRREYLAFQSDSIASHLFFFFALIKLKLKGYVAASWTVAIALAVALLFYKMPVANALASVVYGFFYGLWPIASIIIAAVFVYKSR